jgi:hypothetical protein
MGTVGADTVVPVRSGPVEPRPVFNLSSGYVQRGSHQFPHAGASGPWTLEMAYEVDVERLRFGPVDGPDLQFRYGVQGTPRAGVTTWTGAEVA